MSEHFSSYADNTTVIDNLHSLRRSVRSIATVATAVVLASCITSERSPEYLGDDSFAHLQLAVLDTYESYSLNYATMTGAHFEDYVESMEHTISDEVPLPDNIPVTGLIGAGTGETEDGQPCVQQADLDSIQSDLSSGDTRARVAFVVRGQPECIDSNASGYADVDDNRTVYLTNPDEALFYHEEGHMWGANHGGVIDCIADKPYNLMSSSSVFDIAEDIEPFCQARTKKDTGVNDEYANTDTPMGTMKKFHENESAFTYLERNAIDPSYDPVETVSLIQNPNKHGPKRYTLSTKGGETSGIKIMIDDTHPLRRIDSTIDAYSIGVDTILGGQQDPFTHVRIFAIGDGVNYRIDDNIDHYIAEFDGGKSRTFLTDEHTGIQFNGDSRAPGEVELVVSGHQQ